MRQHLKWWLTCLSVLSCTTVVPAAASAAVQPEVTGEQKAHLTSDVPGSNVEMKVQSEPNDDANPSDGLAREARSAVVMDAATGKVLFEKDAHRRLPMASITKIMTMLLIMEAVDSGNLKLTDQVKTSEYAASMGGSQIFLQPGEVMSVGDMLKGIAMASANDACIAMAEHMRGSAEGFVRQMNQRAAQLGMKDTHFVNCNGLPAPDHYSSAHDIAVMSRELLKHSKVLKYTSAYSDYLRKDTDHPFWLVNTNKLVRFYDGVDGLKTGYTQEAKYCLSATAKRDGFRVITVVMGEPKTSIRNKEVSELFNWSFAHYTSKVLYQAGQSVDELELRHGHPEMLKVVTADTVGMVEEKGQKHDYDVDVTYKENLAPPIKSGHQVGTMVVKDNGRVVASVPLLAGHDVRRTGFFTGVGRVLRDIVTFGS
jgi:serine-type D-Ala-D-Ala carboxypeptidase (penicillin-binding protein 5/6)